MHKKLEHKIILTTSNIKEFVKYFENNKITYEVIDDKTINIYGKHNLAKFISELSKKNLVADKIQEIEETLENYYLNLIGGKNCD